MRTKRAMPPSIRKWGWQARYTGPIAAHYGKLGTVFSAERRDVSPYVFFANDDDNTAHPVTAEDFQRI